MEIVRLKIENGLYVETQEERIILTISTVESCFDNLLKGLFYFGNMKEEVKVEIPAGKSKLYIIGSNERVSFELHTPTHEISIKFDNSFELNEFIEAFLITSLQLLSPSVSELSSVILFFERLLSFENSVAIFESWLTIPENNDVKEALFTRAIGNNDQNYRKHIELFIIHNYQYLLSYFKLASSVFGQDT